MRIVSPRWRKRPSNGDSERANNVYPTDDNFHTGTRAAAGSLSELFVRVLLYKHRRRSVAHRSNITLSRSCVSRDLNDDRAKNRLIALKGSSVQQKSLFRACRSKGGLNDAAT